MGNVIFGNAVFSCLLLAFDATSTHPNATEGNREQSTDQNSQWSSYQVETRGMQATVKFSRRVFLRAGNGPCFGNLKACECSRLRTL
jgi:hypothetical protein